MRLHASPRLMILCLSAAFLAAGLAPARAQNAEPIVFPGSGHTFHGDWQAEASVYRDSWKPGQRIRWEVAIRLADTHLASLASAGIKADKLCVLVTAERTFDAGGWMRLASDERMSTLLTPTGLAIEGGVQGALTTRYGYAFKSVLDQFVTMPVGTLVKDDNPGTVVARFASTATLPMDLPPGLYRLRFDFGAMVGTRVYNINGYTFAARTFSTEAGTCTYYYSPLIPASGRDASGREVDGSAITPRFPWLLLSSYNSNGYRGVIADEDRHRFATSDRSLIPDEVILPMVDDNGNRLSYSLEPQFPADTIDAGQNIAWDWTSGQLAAKVFGPDGVVVDLGSAPIVAKSGNGPTTKRAAFTSWKPQKYGRYTVMATGWIADSTGRRYEGGGTYRFWIAKRLTLATATFQGQPYPVGSSYGRDIQFNPAVPADVTVTAQLFVNSDVANVRTLTYSGKASPAGLFGAAQGMKAFPLNAPGEYHARVLATYTDVDGHLWVSAMRHAGVVYPENSKVIARGKKIAINNKYVDRGETKFEGYIDADGGQHLAHITFPYLSGDMILIGAEGQGANKIEPVLTYQMAGDNSAWDTRLNGVGTTNLSIRTSNNYSPHLYPEYSTDIEYYYGAAPRPGFMGRFIVGESNVRAPYWPVSPNSFGGQIGASPNGDAPGDIYRLLGGVVLRRTGAEPMYSGYISSAFLLPRGTNNNRVVSAGSEDLLGSTGERARFFLVGLRPGTAFELGSTFRPALQIDPLLPVFITFTLHYPDGRQLTATGTSDKLGSFAGPAAWPLDVPGVYKYQVGGAWNGHQGHMPGLPDGGGYFFVSSTSRPAGASGIRLDGSAHRTFSTTAGVTITGSTAAAKVYYTLITPGAVIDQGEIAVSGGRFQYRFDPVAANARAPIYDIVSVTTGKPQIGRVIHLTFFAEERGKDGAPFFDVVRVILRGTTLLAARGSVPASIVALNAPVESANAGAIAEARGELGLRQGANRVSATEPEQLRLWDTRLDRLVRDKDLVVVSREADTVLPDRQHERLQQHYNEVPVAGSNIVRQVRNGVTISVFGTWHAGIDLETVPAIDRTVAAALIAKRTGARDVGIGAPALVVLPLDEGGYALAWRAEARTGTDIRLCDIDARSGAVLRDESVLKRQQVATAQGMGLLGDLKPVAASRVGGGFAAIDRTRAATITTYDLHGDDRRALAVMEGIASLTPADAAMSSSSTWTDRVVVDTHAHLGATYDFYLRRFGRHGLDGQDSPLAAIVHPTDQTRLDPAVSAAGSSLAGAFWNGREVVLGDGSTGTPWAAAFDVVAHELSHAVIDHSAALAYRGESGALAEAFADIMATSAEFGSQPAGSGPGRADYLIGEDVVPGGIRSLANPLISGLRDRYDDGRRTTTGMGGLYADSTIASHAYYLAVEGGVHASTGVTVEGVGRAHRGQIERTLYRAWIYMLPMDATFSLARAATLQSARDLFGDGSGAERALAQAWTAVGVR